MSIFYYYRQTVKIQPWFQGNRSRISGRHPSRRFDPGVADKNLGVIPSQGCSTWRRGQMAVEKGP